jgi:hypothetical protein
MSTPDGDVDDAIRLARARLISAIGERGPVTSLGRRSGASRRRARGVRAELGCVACDRKASCGGGAVPRQLHSTLGRAFVHLRVRPCRRRISTCLGIKPSRLASISVGFGRLGRRTGAQLVRQRGRPQ